MPEDVPDDFNFHVKFGIQSKNEINTFENTVTKDLIEDGTETTDITFTDEEITDIYEKMKDINIMENKQLEPKNPDCMQTPHTEDEWKIEMDGEIQTHAWSGEYCDPTKDAQQLKELRDDIFHLVKNKQAYQELPEPTGGYD
ncbi:hypothetical protein [Alkalibacillus aidingensis]|uniref:hypothetical protein n=1 Tax=Alkalibacillus aidingensis TaxID=2747607 RepID=UPI00166125EA|nr:hypothetical protein [Alkalibacillus aidingensis]